MLFHRRFGILRLAALLALDAAGHPVVSYSGGDLKVLRCGTPTCQ